MTIKKKTPNKKPISILDKAVPVAKLDNCISALFYGRSGTGKTTLSSSFPKPILLLNINENGTDSIHDVPDVDVLNITQWSEIEEVYWAVEDGESKYKTVVIDACHTMQDLAITQGKVENKKSPDDPTSQRDFGVASGLMKSWIQNYTDLCNRGLNVVWLAHDRVSETETDDEEGIAPEVGPRLMPSLSSTITGAVNIVGYTFIKESIIKPKKVGEKKERKVEYCLRIGAHGFYTTKVRKPKTQQLPDFLIDASYDDLLQIVQGKLPQEKEASPKPKTSTPTRKTRIRK